MKQEDLFKGYVPTKNKKCLMPFRGKSQNDLLSYEQVKDRDEYAGILNTETILIDIDDYEQSEIMMQIVEDKQMLCRVYETTRGKHFLFKNTTVDSCGNNKKLACGLTADIKVGRKASYSILKYDGKDRKIIYDIFEDEEYEDLPQILLPVKTKHDFYEMEPGDGRNSALYEYILTLTSAGLSIDETRETIRTINRYVFKEPLEESELETILRDDAFKSQSFFNGRTFLFDKFATFLKNNSHIIKINGQLHIYDNGIYKDGAEDIESEMIKVIPDLNQAKRREVMAYLDILIREDSLVDDANYIAFKNGIYHLYTGELMDFSPSIIITNRINYNYNPDAYCEPCDRTFNKLSCNDPEVRALLEECVGYTFFRRNELRKSFILIGDKANGKSTFLDMIKTLLGEENTCSLDLKEIGDRFKTAELFGKLANIGDDIGDEFIANPAIFKKVVSGESITVEKKGEKPFKFNPYCKLLFSANAIPRIKDKSGAVLDRLVIIPFNAIFSPDDPDFDPYIKYKLRRDDSMEYLIKIGLKGLRRVLDHNRFTISDRVENELKEYEIDNNPILLFLNEIDQSEVNNESTGTVYMKYSEFCIVNGFQAMGRKEFTKKVSKYCDVDVVRKKINGKQYYVFAKKGES